MPITLPAKPDAAVQPAPKIGHLLGRGALALVKMGSSGATLVIMDTSLNVVAQGVVAGIEWPSRPWSPGGRQLAYIRDGALRIVDFIAGEDWLAYLVPLEMRESVRIGFPVLWVENGIVFHLVGRYTSPPYSRPWTRQLGVVAQQPEPVLPMLEGIEGIKVDGDITVTDLSPDGRTWLVAAGTSDRSQSWVFTMDAKDRIARRISPSGEKCSSGKVSADGRQVVLACAKKVEKGIAPIDVWVVNIDGSDARRIAMGEGAGLFPIGLSPDGRMVVVQQTIFPGFSTQESIEILDMADGNVVVKVISGTQGEFVRPVGFSVDNRSYFFLRQKYNNRYGTLVGTLESVSIMTGISTRLSENVAAAFIAN